MMSPKTGGFNEEFYSNSLRMGLLIRLGCVCRACILLIWSQVIFLMNFCFFFDQASGGFLDAPSLISTCFNLLFGTQGRSWRLRSCIQEMGDRKGFHAGSSTGSCFVLDIKNKRNFKQFVLSSLRTSLVVQWLIETLPSKVGGVGLIPGWEAKIPHALWPEN